MIEKLAHFEERMERASGLHERRIRDMELKQSWVAGMAATVGAGASALYGWIANHVK
jgi:hypothetical protein